jgi:uncharacterized protein (DUF885 family)
MVQVKLDDLFEEIMDEWWRDNPVSATYMGIHHYDHLLCHIDRDSRAFQRTKDERYCNRIRKCVKDDSLTRDQHIDAKLLEDNYEIVFYIDDELHPFERNPSLAPGIAMGAINIFMIRDFAPLSVQLEHMLSRMRQIPLLIDEGKENLLHGDNIPAIWVDIAVEQIDSGMSLFDKAIPAFCNSVPEIGRHIVDECAMVKQSLHSYRGFLEKEIRPAATGTFAIGKDAYNHLLRKQYRLPYDADRLKEIGERVQSDTERELDALAAEVFPGKSWVAVIDELTHDYPSREGLKDFYRQEISRLKQFIVKHDIVDIPEGEHLSVIDTPPHQRGILPYAAYMPPAPFDEVQEGNFYVTPVDPALPSEDQDQQLQGHNRYKAVVTALHEGYPGHHLQHSRANRIPSKVRRLFSDTVFIEGWALYCEEMMVEEGYITDPKIALFRLKDQLWRACRVIIDVGLHTGTMTFEEAVDMLVTRARLTKVNALGEVKRYTQSPTQPMSYTVGKLLVQELRNDYRKKMGSAFSLKEFHNRLLSFGSLPLRIIREEMLYH